MNSEWSEIKRQNLQNSLEAGDEIEIHLSPDLFTVDGTVQSYILNI